VRSLERDEVSWKNSMDGEKKDLSFELDMKDEDREAIGSLLGARGTVAKRSHHVTGLSHTISKDNQKLIVKGTVSKMLDETGVKTLYAGYMSFSDETFDIAPILDL